jgi:hypothetical protein
MWIPADLQWQRVCRHARRADLSRDWVCGAQQVGYPNANDEFKVHMFTKMENYLVRFRSRANGGHIFDLDRRFGRRVRFWSNVRFYAFVIGPDSLQSVVGIAW